MSAARMDKVEAGIRVLAEFAEAINRQELAAMAALLAEDCRVEGCPEYPGGSEKERLLAAWAARFEAWPELRLEVEELFGFGSRCILRWKLSRNRESAGSGSLCGVDIARVRNGQISELLCYEQGGPG